MTSTETILSRRKTPEPINSRFLPASPTDIHRSRGYINPARHVRAFGVGLEVKNDGFYTIQQWPRGAPEAAVVSLLASRNSRDGSHPWPFRGYRDRKPDRR